MPDDLEANSAPSAFEITKDSQVSRVYTAQSPLKSETEEIENKVEAKFIPFEMLEHRDEPEAHTIIHSGKARLEQSWIFDNSGKLIKVRIKKTLDDSQGYRSVVSERFSGKGEDGKFHKVPPDWPFKETPEDTTKIGEWNKEFSLAQQRINSVKNAEDVDFEEEEMQAWQTTPKDWVFESNGFGIKVNPSSQEYSVRLQDGEEVQINRGELLGEAHFGPAGQNRFISKSKNIFLLKGLIGLRDFYFFIRKDLKGDQIELPQYIIAHTNERMANMAQRVGFKRTENQPYNKKIQLIAKLDDLIEEAGRLINDRFLMNNLYSRVEREEERKEKNRLSEAA